MQMQLQLLCENRSIPVSVGRTAFLKVKSSSIHWAVRLNMLTGLKLDVQMSVVKLT